MPIASPDPSPLASSSWLAWSARLLLPLAAIAGFAAVWVILAWSKDTQCGWMALLGALDMAWILRLSGWRSGYRRALAGMAGTALIVALANWGIIAAHLGESMGFDPFDSALRLGVSHAWQLAQLANGPSDFAIAAAAVALAAIASR